MRSKRATDSGPWYREPWPWLIMLGPAVVIVAGVATAYLAVISDDGLVADDYYKQGLAINQRGERDRRAAELGLEAELILGGNNDRIRVLLRANEGTLLPAKLALRVTHPTRPGFDQRVSLRSEGGGVYGAELAPIHGRWRLVLEDERQEWLLAGDWESEKQPALTLLPSAEVRPSEEKSSVDKER
ncbi:FixH family protein [Accumulibacter sp.]|uniref:FixH family protein n=1 Tax=Accumulibacter sp. TaxID=2053492 RepID=UPI002BFD053B|nr:FixH family protein [Accumulibacter sp.]HRF04411.1 FixH family protein [Accumulibacter sp.]